MLETSVVIRCLNDAAVVRPTLEAVLAEGGEQTEVLCIDSGSTDGTWEILGEYPVRRLRIRPSEYVPGAVLNLGAAVTRGRYIVFLNSDCTPISEDFLDALTAPLRSGAADGTYGRQRARPDARWDVERDYAAAFPPAGVARPGGNDPDPSWRNFFSMAASAITRAAWLSHAFDPAITFSEDIEWAARMRRAGGRTIYVPEAEVYHSHNYGTRAGFSRAAGEGSADAVIFGETAGVSGLLRALRRWGHATAGDSLAAIRCGRLDRIPLAAVRRGAWHLGRWFGARSAQRGFAVRTPSVPGFERFLPRPTNVSPETWEGLKGRDEFLVEVGAAMAATLTMPPGARLLVIGSHGRGDGSFLQRPDGGITPTNNLDLLLIVRGRRQARRLRPLAVSSIETVSRRLGIRLDIAVVTESALRRNASSLMLFDAGAVHRVLLGSSRAPRAWPQPDSAQLVPRDQLMLVLNRATLLLLNRHLRRCHADDAHLRRRLLLHAAKAVLGFGDAALLALEAYHPREGVRLDRIRTGALGSVDQNGDLARLYAEAAHLRRNPPQDPDAETIDNLENGLKAAGESVFRRLEARRTGRPDLVWTDYPSLVLRDRPLTEKRAPWAFTRRIVSSRDRDLHELLAQLPALLFEPASPSSPEAVEAFLRRWARHCDPSLLKDLLPGRPHRPRPVETADEAAART